MTEAVEAALPSNPLPTEGKKKLPQGDALEAAIAPYRVMARPLVQMVSMVAENLKTAPLDKEEKDSGEVAISAMLYQYQAAMTAEFLLLMWIIGVTAPRVLQYLDEKKKRDEEKESTVKVPPSPVSSEAQKAA